ncbi:MAG: copper ion binding protein [Acidimicrobiales bacterium]
MTTTFTVSGMTCDHCVNAVRTEVGTLDGVEVVDVELATGKVTVNSDTELDMDAVRDAVEEAGYQLAA